MNTAILRLILIILVALTVLLTGCATNHQSRIQEKANVDTKAFDSKKNSFTVKDGIQAKSVIVNRINYLKLFFQPSIDPYFGGKDISSSCVNQTYFSEAREDDEGLWAFAHILADESWQVRCGATSRPTVFVIRYCELDKSIQEHWFKDKKGQFFSPKGMTCSGQLSL